MADAATETKPAEGAQKDGKALLDAFLKEHPEAQTHVVALGKGLFDADATKLKSSLGKVASERDVLRKATKLEPEQLAALTEMGMQQDEAIADMVEKGAPEDLLREFANEGKKPSEIKAYGRRLMALKPTEVAADDTKTRIEALEKMLGAKTVSPGKATGFATEFIPRGGGLVPMPEGIAELSEVDTRGMSGGQRLLHARKTAAAYRAAGIPVPAP